MAKGAQAFGTWDQPPAGPVWESPPTPAPTYGSLLGRAPSQPDTRVSTGPLAPTAGPSRAETAGPWPQAPPASPPPGVIGPPGYMAPPPGVSGPPGVIGPPPGATAPPPGVIGPPGAVAPPPGYMSPEDLLAAFRQQLAPYVPVPRPTGSNPPLATALVPWALGR